MGAGPPPLTDHPSGPSGDQSKTFRSPAPLRCEVLLLLGDASLHHSLPDHPSFSVHGKVVVLRMVQGLLDPLVQVLHGDEVFRLLLVDMKPMVSVKIADFPHTTKTLESFIPAAVKPAAPSV